MRIEEDMQSVSEEELLADKPMPEWLRKLLVRAIAIFMAVLMISLIVLNYPILGQLVSEPVLQDTLTVNDVTVQFAAAPLNMVMNAYRLDVETPLCLRGEKEGTVYSIVEAYVPAIFSQSRTHVTHASCEDTLILFHTHPYKSCLASSTDINTLRRNQEIDADIIMIIMCEPNRFSLHK